MKATSGHTTSSGPDGPRRGLARIVDVQPGEGRVVALASLTFFFLLSSYYVLRPLRDALATTGGRRDLPWLFTATFVTTGLAVPAWSALVARTPRRRLLPIAFQAFVAVLLGFFLLFRAGASPLWTARAFYVWASVFNVIAVSNFWSLATDVFSHDQGKRLFGFVAAGGSAGALLGPALTSVLVAPIGTKGLLLVSAGLFEAAAVCGWWIARAPRGQAETREDEPVGGGALAGFRAVFTSRYLGLIALYLLLTTITGNFGYMLQQTVVTELGDAVVRTQYFARVDFAASLVTILVQALGTGFVLTRLGLRPALWLLPPLTALGFGVFAAVPTLGAIAALMVLRRSAVYAIANPARDVLFTIASREDRYKAKAFIDTVVWRGGDMMSTWAFTAVAGTGLPAPALAGAAAILAVPWFAVARALTTAYARRAA